MSILTNCRRTCLERLHYGFRLPQALSDLVSLRLPFSCVFWHPAGICGSYLACEVGRHSFSRTHGKLCATCQLSRVIRVIDVHQVASTKRNWMVYASSPCRILYCSALSLMPVISSVQGILHSWPFPISHVQSCQ